MDWNWYWNWGMFVISVLIFLLGVLVGATLREEKHKKEKMDIAITNTIEEEHS
jgi:hypothetical protein